MRQRVGAEGPIAPSLAFWPHGKPNGRFGRYTVMNSSITPFPPLRHNDPALSGTLDYRLERAFARIADSDLRQGNAVALQKDAEENYPAWL